MRLHHHFQMASREVRSNVLHLLQRNLPVHLRKVHFLWTYSSCRRPAEAMDVRIPVLEVEDPVPSGRLASKSCGNE